MSYSRDVLFSFLLLGRECDLCYFFQFFFLYYLREMRTQMAFDTAINIVPFFLPLIILFLRYFLHATFGVDLPLPCDIDVTSLGNEWVGLRKGETRAKSIRIIRSIMASDKIEPEMILSFKKEIQVVTMQLVPGLCKKDVVLLPVT